MSSCKLYTITVGTGYRGGGMVIAARSKEEAIGLIHTYEDDAAKAFMQLDTLKELDVTVKSIPAVLFCDYYVE